MEARVRAQLLIGAACGVALGACGGGGEKVTPEPDDRPPEVAVNALVERAHGARRGTFGSILLEVRRTPDGPATTIAAELPERIRISEPDGHTAVLDGAEAWSWDGDEPPGDASEDDVGRLSRWLTALDLICFQPLERAGSFERLAPDRIACIAGGERFELEYDAASDAPRALSGPMGAVRFVELYDSGRTLIPIEVDVEGLGRWHLRFRDTGVEFESATFRPRGSIQQDTFVLGGPDLRSAPRIEATPEVWWLMAPDPGDWAGRMEIYSSAGPRLGSLGYGNGGDPMLVEDGDGRWFVIPYRPVRADAEPVEPGANERVVSVPAGRAVVADADPAEFASRVAATRARVRDFLDARDLEPAGAPRVAVNLIHRDPAGDPTTLDDAPLRVIWPIER